MRARSLTILAVALAAVAACGGPVVSPGVSAPPAGATTSPAPVTAPPATAPAASPSSTSPAGSGAPATDPPPSVAPIAIALVECLQGQTVRLTVHIEHEAGIVSYQVWSTWGGGGETTRSFPTPYRTVIDETLEFTHALIDPEPERIHQFGLAVTVAGIADPILTYQVEPGNRCPGH